MFPFVLLWFLRRVGNSLSNAISSEKFSVKAMICKVLGNPYQPKLVYWESILLLFRLFAVSVATFVTSPAVSLLLLFFGSGFMLGLHVHFLFEINELSSTLYTFACSPSNLIVSPNAFACVDYSPMDFSVDHQKVAE